MASRSRQARRTSVFDRLAIIAVALR
jgi:hypothetical protein